MLQIKDFYYSEGGLDRFKERYNIEQFRISGEASSVDQSIVLSGRTKFKEITKKYSQRDIYNLDETALFYKLQPYNTLASSAVTGT